MKKITLFAFSLLACSSAFAGSVTMDATTGKMVIKTTDSSILTENVTINLSNNVQAGASTDLNEIALSTCHTAGRQSAREVVKQVCTTTNGVESCIPDPAGATETKSGAVMNTATTSAGTVAPVYPNVACDSAKAATTAATKLTPDT